MIKKFVKNSPLVKSKKGQIDLNFPREKEKDRNFDKGGRSFYFFDFDDNVAFLSTNILIFHKKTNKAKELSTVEYYQFKDLVGKPGSPFSDYYFDYEDSIGSYRNFRDKKLTFWDRLTGKRQLFVMDLKKALDNVDLTWKAPSWNYFYHATFNHRPLSIITARGHQPETIKQGIKEFVKYGHLTNEPNYLKVFPVTHPKTRVNLGDHDNQLSVAELKRLAIKESFYEAIKTYGENPHHRFGMSDDDPANVNLITEAMLELKKDFPKMSFFVIDTNDGKCEKKEIKLTLSDKKIKSLETEQLPLNL